MTFFCRICVGFLLASSAFSASPASAQWLTGKKYHDALKEQIGGLTEKSLRDAFTEVAGQRGVAFVIDRRVNPSRVVKASYANQSRLFVLEMLAAKAEADVTVLDNVVYVGPPDFARNLRTLIEMRRYEAAKLPNKKALRKERDVSWNMLAEPQKLLADIGSLYELGNETSRGLPHDLWAAASLPSVDASTVLSVLLTQFGLTFEWRNGGKDFRLLGEPKTVAIEQSFVISRSVQKLDLVAIADRLYPEADVKQVGKRLKVRGRVEAIEGLRRIASGKEEAPPPQPRMDTKLFGLETTGYPFLKLMNGLRESGNAIEWDEDAIRVAGIDLGTQIDVKVSKMPTSEFFKVICDQVPGLGFRVEKYKVVLFPK